MSIVWKMKPQADAAVLTEYRGLHSLQALLLWQRGVSPDRSGQFLSPRYEDLYSPFLFRQMEKAVDRLWEAIENEEKIFVYADYDADAVTASAVLEQTFKYLEVPVETYIPDRFSEGYGLNEEAFRQMSEMGVKVVVTVDCGVNSRKEAELCKELGITLIITDHHELIGDVPDAFCLVNPKLPGEAYPDPQITGVGVAFKLACALLSKKSLVVKRLAKHQREHVENWEKWLLDLVAIGTVADCHSLLGENRILVHYGLLVLRKTRWLGLRELLRLAGADLENLNTHTLGFLLAPRINAAGRLEHASIALRTLLSEDLSEAQGLAARLEEINTRRQESTKRLISEAREQAALYNQDSVLVLSSDQWHKGVVGIAAGRLAEDFGKPSIVLAEEGEKLTGSVRTYGEFNVIEALQSCAEYLEKFGGHKQAAGLTLSRENLDYFRVGLNKYAQEHQADLASNPLLELDTLLDPKDISLDLYDLIGELEPFGVENEKPKFLLSGIRLSGLKRVGGQKEHAQVWFSDSGYTVSGIGFQKGYLCDSFYAGQEVAVAAELLADTWNGVRKVKLRVLDMKGQTE